MTDVMAPPAESPVTKMRCRSMPDIVLTARAIICLIEQASPLSRAVSSGLNQLKQPLALFDGCCCGISNAKP